jgi:hypothetical protein
MIDETLHPPGSFALPIFYQETTDIIKSKGYDLEAIHKPSVGPSAGQKRPEGLPTMYDDAAHIASVASKYIDQGKDVVLIAHSYGGAPTTQSTKGLTKPEREKEGKTGGIRRVGYMTCIVPALGQNAVEVMSEVPEEYKLNLAPDESGWMAHTDYERVGALCFSDLPVEEGAAWIKKFPQHSGASFMTPLTHQGYKDVPVSYLFCEKDQCVTPNVQQIGIDLVEKESGRKVDVTRIQGDHCPMASQPGVIADWIMSVADKQ